MADLSFETLANQVLEDLFEQLETAVGDDAEVDFENGILTVELESGGQYVINKNAPSRQIWLSSPKSGAHHFDQDEATGRWVSTRGAGDLLVLLGGELGASLMG